jgi:hypothetical protein
MHVVRGMCLKVRLGIYNSFSRLAVAPGTLPRLGRAAKNSAEAPVSAAPIIQCGS